MRKYIEIFKSQLQLDAAYNGWFWANAVASVIGLLIAFSFWHAVYRHTAQIANMNLPTMISYVVIAMILGNYVSGVGNRLSESIRSGEVAIELMKPYDLLLKLIWLDLGSKVSASVRNSLPLLVIGYAFLGVLAPVSLASGALFAVSAMLGVLIGTQFDLIIGVLAFWTVNIWGLRVLRGGILSIFTGTLIPVTLFPAWLLHISEALPFQSMVYTPVAIYTGAIPLRTVGMTLLIQAAWLIGLYVLVRLIWSAALRKLVIFGG